MSQTDQAGLLEAIVAATRRRVALQARRRPIGEIVSACTRAPRGAAFAAALSETPVPRVIAECKRRSPSRGVLRRDYDAADIAASYEVAGAAAISVLTEPTFFDGDVAHLRAVRARVALPLLRKDFIVTPYQVVEAREAGADAVLLIVAALDGESLGQLHGLAVENGLAALVEVHDERELERALDAGARIIGVNSRNLRTLQVDLDVARRLAPRVPRGVLAVAESGVKMPGDLDELGALGYAAFLVGERFMTAADPGAALADLRSRAISTEAGGTG
jgi:indole-3-glycerol phosphate synthase